MGHRQPVFVMKAPNADAERRADAGNAHDGQLMDLQRRVRDGSYDNRGVMEQVARRILQCGDL
jgi:hypothetical protein